MTIRKKAVLLILLWMAVIAAGITVLKRQYRELSPAQYREEGEIILPADGNDVVKEDSEMPGATEVKEQEDLTWSGKLAFEFEGDGGDSIRKSDGKAKLLATMGGSFSVWGIEDKAVLESMEWTIQDGKIPVSFFAGSGNEVMAVTWKAGSNRCALERLNRESGIWETVAELEQVEGESYDRTCGFMVSDVSYDDGIICALMKFDASGERSFCIFDGNGRFLWREEGCYAYERISPGTFLVYGDKNGSSLRKVMLEEGQLRQVWRKELALSNVWKVHYEEQTDSALLLSDTGIFRLGLKDGEEAELLFSRTGDAWQIPAAYDLWDFCMGQDGDLYLLYCDYAGQKKKVYQFTQSRVENRSDYITVSLPFPIAVVEMAAKIYEGKYADRKVILKTDYHSEDEWKQEYGMYGVALQEQAATGVMLGEYGDVQLSSYAVYGLDVMGTDAYLDLKDWILTLENYSDLNENALEAAEVQGSLRGIPAAIALNFLFVQEDLFREADADKSGSLSWSEVLDEAILWKEQGRKDCWLFENYNEYQVLDAIVYSNIYDLVDPWEKKADIRQEWFTELLEKWKRVSAYGTIKAPPGEDAKEDRLAHGLKSGAMMLVYNWENAGKARGNMAADAAAIHASVEESGKSVLILPCIYGEKNRNYFAFPRLFFSVNPASGKKQEALDFIEVLLNEEVQGRLDYGLMPLNRKGLEKQYEYALQTGTPVEQEKVTQLFKSLDETACQIDEVFSYLCAGDLLDALYGYASGEMTLERALTEAEEKIWIRINE